MSEPLLDLDLASAHLYLSVVDLGSISKAAARHGLSQPSASQRVRKLERQLGLTLLDRTASGSTLTPDGREVARWCREVVEAAGSMADEARSLRDQRRLHTTVAATAGVARHLVPRVCAALAATSPALAVDLRIAPTLEACALVREGSADIGLVDGPAAPLSLASEVVASWPLRVVVRPDRPWAGRRQAVSPAELAGTAIVLRDRGSGTRDVIEDALAGAGHPLRDTPASEAPTTEAVLTAAVLGVGVAVVSEADAAQEVDAGRLRVARDAIGFRQPVRLVWSGDEPHAAGARRFAAACRQAR
ncbi:MAG: LysR substrate-binding domain-containing protein [Actinomycetota bacterium]